MHCGWHGLGPGGCGAASQAAATGLAAVPAWEQFAIVCLWLRDGEESRPLLSACLSPAPLPVGVQAWAAEQGGGARELASGSGEEALLLPPTEAGRRRREATNLCVTGDSAPLIKLTHLNMFL